MAFILSTVGFIGAGILVLLLTLFAAFIVIKIYFHRLESQCKAEEPPTIDKVPNPYQARIKIVPKYKQDLIYEDDIESWTTTLEKLGYQRINDAKQFEITCFSKIALHIFENSASRSYAIFYESYGFNDVYFKFIQIHEDHSVQSISNYPFDNTPFPTRYETVYNKDISLNKALKRFNTELPKGGLLYLDGSEFIAFLEYMYAEQYDYLVHLNYVDDQYLQTLLDSANTIEFEAPNQAFLPKLRDYIAATYKLNTHEILLKSFIAKYPQYTEQSHQLIIIHERQTAEDIWHEYFTNIFIELDYDVGAEKIIEKNYLGQEKQEMLDKIKDQWMNQPFQYMDDMLHQLPNPEGIQMIGTMTYPLKNCIFLVV